MASRWQDLSRPPLRQTPLRRALTDGPDPAWRLLDLVEETGSTNAELARRARAGEAEGVVLVADHQTSGRGRRDRTWTAPPRASLTFSVLLTPAEHGVPAERWSWLTLLAGIAVTDALVHTCGLPAVLKWPNDVLVPVAELGSAARDAEKFKLAGLLAEVVRPASSASVASAGSAGSVGSAVVLGIGINITQDVDELPVPSATSLKLAGSATIDRDTVLRSVLRALADRYRDWIAVDGDPRAGLAAVYRERCDTIGRPVRVHLPDGSLLDGLAEGVDDEGRLLVRPQSPPASGASPGLGSAGLGPVGADLPVRALSAGDVVHIRPPEPA